MDEQVPASLAVMEYHEKLPGECPPANVECPQTNSLWRLMASVNVTAENFKSEALANPTRVFRDPCGGRSISLVPTFAQAAAAAKSPIMRKKNFTHAVEIQYSPVAGVWHLDKPTHCHFWPYFGFDYAKCIGVVKELP